MGSGWMARWMGGLSQCTGAQMREWVRISRWMGGQLSGWVGDEWVVGDGYICVG